jgi:hypothetical protein
VRQQQEYDALVNDRARKTIGEPIVAGPGVSERGVPAPEPFPTVDCDSEPEAPPEMHVERLLLDRDLNLFAGPKGAGKTPVLLTTAVAVATGWSAFGSLKVARRGDVVIAAPEDGHNAAKTVIRAIVTGLGLNEGDRHAALRRIHVVSDDARVNLTQHISRLRETVAQYRAVLLVLDPIRNLLGGQDENDANVAGQVADELRREICREAGATVGLSMHRRKLSRERGADPDLSLDDVRGSSAWVAAARVVFSVAQSPDSRLIDLRCLAANRFRPADARHTLRLIVTTAADNPAAWASCSLVEADDGLTPTLTPGAGRPLRESERAVLAVLHDPSEPDLQLSASAWGKRSGQAERTFYDVKVRLAQAALTEAVPTEKRTPSGVRKYAYQITAKGRDALLGQPIEDPR